MCVVFNPYHVLLLLFFLANKLLLLHFLPKNIPRVETLFDPGQSTPKPMDVKPAPRWDSLVWSPAVNQLKSHLGNPTYIYSSYQL